MAASYSVGDAPLQGRSIPAQSLHRRLQTCADGQASWAAYLPAQLWQVVQKGGATVASSAAELGELSRRITPAAARCEANASANASKSVLSGCVWSRSKDPQGCREVQRALELAASEEERLAIAMEMQGHVWDAMRCPHANYVLQKCIVLLNPLALQFVIDEIVKKGDRAIAQSARHKYGCRILQRLLERCGCEQVSDLADSLLKDTISTCRHPYGNYVMQHLLDYGDTDKKRALVRLLEQNAALVGADEYACAVVGKAMTCGQREDQVALAQALAKVPETISFMARTRHGHVAARLVLQTLEGADHEQAHGQIRADATSLRNSRYGRLVVASLHQGSS